MACLTKTEQAHNQAQPGGRRTDAGWPAWYARYLLEQTELNQYSHRQWTGAELAEALAQLDAGYQNGSQNHSWAQYCAARLSS